MDISGRFGIITYEVLFDKNISDGAKLFYVHVSMLSNNTGFCWASNEYLEKKHNTSKSTVIRWVSELVDSGYLMRHFIYKEGTKQVTHRLLRIVMREVSPPEELIKILSNDEVLGGVKNDTTGILKNNTGVVSKMERGGVKNDTYNSISNNNIKDNSIIPANPPELFPEFSKAAKLYLNGEAEKKEKTFLFKNTTLFEMVAAQNFDQKKAVDLVGQEYDLVDLKYYFAAVRDWAAFRNKKSALDGWVGIVRRFVQGDKDKGKLKTLDSVGDSHRKFDFEGMRNYLEEDKEF